ncbi:MAG: two-component system sensor histidine kinase NtrB [Mahellales bacterium]|jgi:signal transduction histidine kinase
MNPDVSQHLLWIEKVLGEDCAFICLTDKNYRIYEILSKDTYIRQDIEKGLALKGDYLSGIIGSSMEDCGTLILSEKDHGLYGLTCYCAPIFDQDDKVSHILFAFCTQEKSGVNIPCLMEVAAYCTGREFIYAHTINDLEQRNNLLVKQKEGFVDNILIFAHEIKNSISNLSACIQLLKLNMDGEGRAKADNMLEQVAVINNIIGQLVNWGKTNKLKLTKMSINQLIENICGFVEDRARLKGITLKVNTDDKPIYANIDTSMMEQVFINIMDNAFAAMEYGGVLEITAKGDFERKIVNIEFKDYGCGIPDENKDKLFQLFFTTKANGSGLGLSLCNNIISGHGGTIEVDSQQGRGTTFKIKLPMVI